MHTRLRIIAVALAVIGLGTLLPAVLADPAAAGPICIRQCSSLEPTDEGLLATVRSQVDEVNSYVSHPTPCTGTDDDTGLPITGFLRWTLTANPQEVWDLETGVMYRLECWSPEAGDFGHLLDLRVFDAITPENLARLALAQLVQGLPAPEPHLNPAGTTLVNLDTWLSVGNITSDTVTSSPLTVPGITVVVQATTGGVEWTMGDGTPSFVCSGIGPTGSPGPDSCWQHYYRRSSAGEPGGQFHGNARVVWLGTYTINGVSGGVEIPVPLEAPFSIQVAEAQAVIVR
jgi:hypothetical protein